MKKQSKYIVVGAIALIITILLLFTSFGTLFGIQYSTTATPLTVNGYTGTYSYTDGAHPVHDKIAGKVILRGTSNEVMSSPYSMDGSGNSATITLAGTTHVYTWDAGHDYVGQPRHPSVLIGRYWWEGTYFPSGQDPTGSSRNAVSLFSSGGASAYVSLTSGSFGMQTFPGITYTTSYTTVNLGGTKSWATPGTCPIDYTQTSTLSTSPVSFKVTGYRSGTIKVSLYVEYCELSVWGILNSVYGYHYNYAVVKTDIADLSAAPSYVYTVSSTPTGASVSVGGKTGTTPTSFTLTAGTYTVTMTKSGYDTKTYSVSLTAAKSETITLTKTAVTYSYTVKTTPASCSVTISGTTVDSGSSGAVFSLAAGTYSVSTSKSGYNTYTYSVTISAAKTDTITLTATGGGGGGGGTTYSYTVKTTPASCSVTISGTTVDSGSSGAVFSLAAGTYSISVSKTGYSTSTYSTSISAAKTDTITLSANPTTYYYTVKTVPTSCSVTISGTTKDSGTAGAVFGLLSGTYSVTISKSGYNTNTYSVTISADKTDTITVVMTNQKPLTPSISYPLYHSGYIGDSIAFELNAWDPNQNEQLQYHMDWGDGVWTSYTAFTNEVNEATSSSNPAIITKASQQVTHTWTSVFSGNIRAQSRDAAGIESDIYTYAWSALEKPRYDLTVMTTPSDCTVTVEGQGTQNSGSYGAVFSSLQTGTYSISVSKTGYYSDSTTVNFDSSKTVTFTLQIITYSLTVVTNPISCSVTINGNTKNSGSTGAVFSGLVPDIYTATISKQGYTTKIDDINIFNTDKTETVTLDQIKVNLRITTDPTSCDVTVQGQTKNSGTAGAIFSNLVAGTYTIQVSKQYYQTASDTITITDVDASKIITLSRSAFDLTVLTVPNNCDVSIDGVVKNSGSTGSIKYEYLVKGSHTVTVSKQEYKTNITTIILDKDDVIRMRLPPQTYILTINTIPTDCSISVTPTGGMKTSTNGVATFDLEKGTYSVTASKTGYTVKTQSVTITTAPTSLSFTLTPAHILTIITEPTECKVTIQGVGEQISNATSGKAIFFNILENTYNVTVSKTGYNDLKSNLTVNSDATVTFSLTKRTIEKKTPGFEIATLLISIGIAFLMLRKKHKNK